MEIATLKRQKLILLECISGSKAYGLDTPTSDTDIKGVYLLPKKEFYGLSYTPQVNNSSNDEVYYELGRFIELLSVNNPNILELLNTPASAVLYKHPLMELIQPELFLSKLCKNTFGKFALSQIKKAKGLNKKILNPMDKVKKSVLDFCYINHQQGAIPLQKFLAEQEWKEAYCGLTNIPQMKNMYGLYYSEGLEYKGVAKGIEANDVRLSSIPKGEKPVALLYFNKDGYSAYCKKYKEYWKWVEERNEVRFENTQSHGKNYDAKNMMHVFRLLDMAIEIGKYGKVNVQRPNRDFLLSIKSGKYEYDDLLEMAESKKLQMEEAFLTSKLPDTPDLDKINTLLFTLREKLYNG